MEIIDTTKKYYYIPSQRVGITIDCPYCGNKRTLMCFNVGNKERPQFVDYGFSMCSSPSCRNANKVGTFPMNKDFESLLRIADERDGVPVGDTETKLRLMRKHTKGDIVVTETDKQVDWNESEKQYQMKLENSCMFSAGMTMWLQGYNTMNLPPMTFADTQLGKYLIDIFGKASVMQVVDMYNLYQTADELSYSQFPYYDINGNLRNIKRVAYGINGHRTSDITQGYYFQKLIQDQLKVGNRFYYEKIENNNVRQPILGEKQFNNATDLFLFGEHLINKFPKARVIIVESEKSALIMQMHYNRHAYGKYIVLATGSMYYFRPSMFVPLKGRNVFFFADNDKAETYWKEKITLFGEEFFNPVFTNWKDKYANVKAKSDYADLLIEQYKQEKEKQTKQSDVAETIETENIVAPF